MHYPHGMEGLRVMDRVDVEVDDEAVLEGREIVPSRETGEDVICP